MNRKFVAEDLKSYVIWTRVAHYLKKLISSGGIILQMSGPKEKLRKYQLIKFNDEPEDDDNTLVNIDRVPCHWVRYSIEHGEIVAKFPPPPYTKQKQTLLEKLIKTEGTPPPSWPEYPVQLIGHAGMY